MALKTINPTLVAYTPGGGISATTVAGAISELDTETLKGLGGYTVGALPAAGTAGRRAYVTDATAPTFLGTLTGGGSVVCPVFDNGSAWVAG